MTYKPNDIVRFDNPPAKPAAFNAVEAQRIQILAASPIGRRVLAADRAANPTKFASDNPIATLLSITPKGRFLKKQSEAAAKGQNITVPNNLPVTVKAKYDGDPVNSYWGEIGLLVAARDRAADTVQREDYQGQIDGKLAQYQAWAVNYWGSEISYTI